MSNDVWTIRENNTDSVLFLLHGFTGHLKKSWAGFPALLKDRLNQKEWDIFSLGYPTSFWALELRRLLRACPGIQKLADTLATRMKFAFGGYPNIAFLAHSMGGLVVQRAILDHAALRERVRHVFLFGTPSMGLEAAHCPSIPPAISNAKPTGGLRREFFVTAPW